MKQLFDCYDFCNWSLGEEYHFDDYEAPEGTVYMPDLSELIELSERY